MLCSLCSCGCTAALLCVPRSAPYHILLPRPPPHTAARGGTAAALPHHQAKADVRKQYSHSTAAPPQGRRICAAAAVRAAGAPVAPGLPVAPCGVGQCGGTAGGCLPRTMGAQPAWEHSLYCLVCVSSRPLELVLINAQRPAGCPAKQPLVRRCTPTPLRCNARTCALPSTHPQYQASPAHFPLLPPAAVV